VVANSCALRAAHRFAEPSETAWPLFRKSGVVMSETYRWQAHSPAEAYSFEYFKLQYALVSMETKPVQHADPNAIVQVQPPPIVSLFFS
jgi:hypothetical protein